MNKLNWWQFAGEHGLLAALEAVAAERGVALSAPDLPAKSETRSEASVADPRGFVAIGMVVASREYFVRIGAPAHDWAHGVTDDLAEVIAVIAAWRSGVSLGGLHAAHPFMEPTVTARHFLAGTAVEHRWQLCLDDPDYADINPLLSAAHANDTLAGLYPSVTMFALARFALDATDRTAGEILIRVNKDAFEVWSTHADKRFHTTDIASAVEVAAALVPKKKEG